jgi:glycolate oxidase FAD binding subunit
MGEIAALKEALRSGMPGIEVSSDTSTLRDFAVDGLLPRLLALPSSVAEAAHIVATTGKYGLTLIARGGGSRMDVGGMPQRIDVLLETTRLSQLLQHEAPDLTCHVEAGITLAALQSRLATQGQRLALDPFDAAQATIGGLLASNASGPKRLRYGSARDLVIGLRVIQANGEIARSGGGVVKNVAGYDLNKLYIGSMGTLGVIVEANFKLHPLPVAERTLLLTYTSAEAAMQTVVAIAGSPLTPSALELIDAGAASDMSDFFGVTLSTNGYTLAVNFEGSRTSLERQIDETRLLARKHGALLGDDLRGDAQDRFWDVVREQTQGSMTCKVSILVSRVAGYLQEVEQVCRRHELEAAVVAHAGNGILYVELGPTDATPRLVAAITELRRLAQAARGNLLVEHCPVDLKRLISVWGEAGADFYLMRRLKEQFDPGGTFVSGRFVGGL